MTPIMDGVAVGVIVFLILSLPYINYMINDTTLYVPYPLQVVCTPIAIFLMIMGLLGLILLRLTVTNFQNGSASLAKKQFFVGFILLYFCFFGLEVLYRLSLK